MNYKMQFRNTFQKTVFETKQKVVKRAAMFVRSEILEQILRTAQQVKAFVQSGVSGGVCVVYVGCIIYRPSPSGTSVKCLMLGSSAFPHRKKCPCGSPPSVSMQSVFALKNDFRSIKITLEGRFDIS